jgi:hypothetical protein
VMRELRKRANDTSDRPPLATRPRWNCKPSKVPSKLRNGQA